MTHSAAVPMKRTAFLTIGLSFLVAALPGCSQGLGGGGSIDPTVTIRLDGDAAATAAADDANVEVAGYGSVSGRVILEGPPPNLSGYLPATIEKDANVCNRGLMTEERLVVNNGGVKNVFIYLARKPAGVKAELASPPSETVFFDQKTCTFVPHALVIRTGQEMRILNDDTILHNTHTNPTSNDIFNQSVGVKERDGVPYTYQRPEREPVRVVCDFHSWMLAWHLPIDHPYGTITDDNGAFEIKDLPAGEHRLVVWHEGSKLMDYNVTIEPDQTTPAEIKLTSATFARREPGKSKTVVLSMSETAR